LPVTANDKLKSLSKIPSAIACGGDFFYSLSEKEMALQNLNGFATPFLCDR
jgi:hypothetical protein